VRTAFAKPEFLKRLEQPELLLRSPTRIIKPEERTRLPLVAQVDLSELEGLPLIVKRQRPRGLSQIAKGLFCTSSARREFETSLLFEASRLPTAMAVAAGERRCRGLVHETYLISALVPETRMLHAVNLECTDRTQRVRIVRSFARTIASLHDASFSHTDPSLTNFLVGNAAGPSPQIYIIDLDGVKLRPTFLERLAVKDLYRLFHRSHALAQERLWFLAQYCRARRQRLQARDLAGKVGQELLAAGYRHGLKPNQVFGDKPHGGLSWQVRWPLVTPQVERILRAPDHFLEQAKVLKPSRSSAVSAAGGVVLKRYNYRKWLSRFKDTFRASRGRRSFQQAYRLESAGVATARPIAAADRRRCGLLVSSYFVMAEIPDAVLLPAWSASPEARGQQVAELLARMHDAGFTHRDLKGGNVLLDSTGRPHLIDLDGLRFVRRVSDSRAAADLARLARDTKGWQRRVSRSGCARFLIAYCRGRKLPDWRWWWRAIERRLRV
jgi:tRNA A-37 threonylcarbamoyl transferase component Bud32